MRARKKTVEISLAGCDLEVSGEYTPRERGSAPTLEYPGDPDCPSEFALDKVLVIVDVSIRDREDITELLSVSGDVLDTIANAAADALDEEEDNQGSGWEDYDHEE